MELWEEHDYRRQRICDKAIEAADRIIMENADGSVEELNYLTARVAEAFMKKALQPHTMAIMKYDFLVKP
jgi:hypothetical protein